MHCDAGREVEGIVVDGEDAARGVADHVAVAVVVEARGPVALRHVEGVFEKHRRRDFG